MKVIKSLCLLIWSFNTIIAQEFKVDIAYNYLYSKQWDKAIQTYNFSRPFLKEQQPLLMNGINLSSSYIFKSNKNVHHGIIMSYSYFGSKAENINLVNKLNLHFLNIGYIIHYENLEKIKLYYFDLTIAPISSFLFRKVNEEPYVYDDKKMKAIGVGGNLGFKIGYYLPLKNSCKVSPYISINYTPYLYSPNTETVINQTKALLAKKWTSILSLQIGVSVHIK
jgi:hypothetical protein